MHQMEEGIGAPLYNNGYKKSWSVKYSILTLKPISFSEHTILM